MIPFIIVNRAIIADSRVVDQHINAAELSFDFGNCFFNFFRIRKIGVIPPYRIRRVDDGQFLQSLCNGFLPGTEKGDFRTLG